MDWNYLNSLYQFIYTSGTQKWGGGGTILNANTKMQLLISRAAK